MSMDRATAVRWRAGILAAVLVAGGGGYWLGQHGESATAAGSGQSERKILYWYDPMVPAQRFDKPGKSPFMDMQLVPKYAGEADTAAGGVSIDPAKVQILNLAPPAIIAAWKRGDIDATYVWDPALGVAKENGKVKLVRFGDPDMTIKKHIPERRANFRARHGCDDPGSIT